MVIDRSIIPEIKAIRDVHLSKPLVVAGSVPIYAYSGGDQPVVLLELNFNTGRAEESKKLTSAFTSRMLMMGAGNHSAGEVAEIIDFNGAKINCQAGYENGSISLFCLKKHFRKMLELLVDIWRRPHFLPKELKIQQENSIQRLTVNKQKTDFLAQRAFHKSLFGKSHKYGYHATKPLYEAITVEDLKAFHAQTYTKPKYALLSGMVDDDEIRSVREVLSNTQKKGGTNLSTEPFVPMPGKTKVHKEGAQQASIRIGKPTINANHSDYNELALLNAVLGGYFGSRLMSNIREDKGYTYGIYCQLGSLTNEGFWLISTEVGNKIYPKALKEIYFEIERLQQETISESELNLVKNYMLGSYLSKVDGPISQTKTFKSLLGHGQSVEDFHNGIEVIKAATPKKLKELANTYLSTEDLIEVVAG